jgi:hypothetical protein
MIARSADHGPARDYRAFLRAIRDEPGNRAKAVSAMAFVAALASTRGVAYAAVVLAATGVAIAALGLLAWRHWGK